MPHQESEQFVLFETYLCEVGSIRAYARNIREMVRLMATVDRDLARVIDQNAELIESKARAAIATHSEFAQALGYRWMRESDGDAGT